MNLPTWPPACWKVNVQNMAVEAFLVEFRLTPTMAILVIWFKSEAMFCTGQRPLYSIENCARQETILQIS
jgi:hypothetical protein